MSEKKSTRYDIAKVHAFIDHITLSPEGSTPSYPQIKQQLQQKRLFDEPAPTAPAPFQEDPKVTLPAWETVTPELPRTETTDSHEIEEAGLPEFEPIPENQIIDAQDDAWLSTYDLLEIEVTWDTIHGQHDRNHQVPEPVSFEEVPSPEPGSQHPKNTRPDRKRLRKELMLKVKRERQEYLKQERDARRLKRLEERNAKVK